MARANHKLLVANRGEIALRIIRSAVELDIPTLSIYTDADAAAPHVFRATESVSVSSYIEQDNLIQVCKDNKVTMVHPGYGFLSENEVSCLSAVPTGKALIPHRCRNLLDASRTPASTGSARRRSRSRAWA